MQTTLSQTKTVQAVVLAATLLVSVCSFAKTSTEDFNAMIEENTTAQKQLTNDLQKQLNTKDVASHKSPDFKKVGDAVVGKRAAENVAVDSAAGSQSAHRNVHTKSDKKDFHRIADEMKDVK